MSKGNFEVALPKPYLTGDIYADIYEIGGANPTAIVRMDQDWGVNIHWDLKGSLAPFMCGEWCLHLRLESMGPGREIVLDAPKRIPLNPCGEGSYEFDFRVGRGKIKAEHCSIPYKPVVTITYYTACHTPGPIAGFVELPIMQFYDPGKGRVYGGNGKHAVEANDESGHGMIEMIEAEDEGDEVKLEAEFAR